MHLITYDIVDTGTLDNCVRVEGPYGRALLYYAQDAWDGLDAEGLRDLISNDYLEALADLEERDTAKEEAQARWLEREARDELDLY